MPVGPKNIILHELVGLKARVINAPDPSLIGLEGRVVDETMNTLLLETEKGEKRVPKRYTTFLFQLPDGRWTEVKGEEILYRPVERTKRAYKKYLKRKAKTYVE